MSRRRCFASAVIAALLVPGSVPAPAAIDLTGRRGGEGCRWVALAEPRPLAAQAMAWSDDGARLLLPDPLRGEVFVYRPDGSLERRLRQPGEGELEYIRPRHIVAHEGGFLLHDRGLHLVRLDGDGEPVGSLDLESRPFPNGQRVGALFNWTVVGRSFVSFSDVLRSDGEWRSGWYRLSHTGAPELEAIREVERGEPEDVLDRLGFPYAVAAGERAWVLMMAEEPYLLEIEGARVRRLASFPPGFAPRPRLPSAPRAADVPAVMAAVERSALPVGLYTSRGLLHVLTRRPSAAEGTVWELTAIDPEADRVVARVRLPTSAPHLVAAPGPDRWAFLEKGPLAAPGEQETRTLLFVPAWSLRVASGGADARPACE